MATYVMLTRVTPETLRAPGELKRLEQIVADHVRRDCPQVKWLGNYALLGPYDYLDLFEAPDEGMRCNGRPPTKNRQPPKKEDVR